MEAVNSSSKFESGSSSSSSSSSVKLDANNNLNIVNWKKGIKKINANKIYVHGDTGTYQIIKPVVEGFNNIFMAENVYEKKELVCAKIQDFDYNSNKYNMAIHEGIIHQLLCQEEHKNVIGSEFITQFYEYIIDRGNKKHIIIMEYSKLGNLIDVLNKKSNLLTPYSMKYICRDIALGLRFMHSLGIGHRDIKLDNILLFYSKKLQRYTAKIADFGFSHFFSPIQKYIEPIGTMDYSPPEVIQKIPHKTIPQDIYSLGVVYYILVNRYFPFSNGLGSNWTNKEFTLARINICNGMMYDFIGQANTDAILLIRSMMRLDPNLRPSFNIILNNDWLSLERTKPDIILSMGTLSSRNSYNKEITTDNKRKSITMEKTNKKKIIDTKNNLINEKCLTSRSKKKTYTTLTQFRKFKMKNKKK